MGLAGRSVRILMSPSSTNQYRVYLFGTFHIDVKAQPIRLPTRKTESLLAYLILYPGAHSREKLAALFWGDSSNAAARGSLRKALTLLRKNINGNIVVSNRESVQLNPSSPVWVDVIEFQQQARKFLIDPASHSNPNMWDLYQDDLLCDVYDDWVIPLREQYRLLYLDTKLRMVEILRAESEYKNAIMHAKEILAMDPANERAHQHLMFCYVTLGDRNKALHQFELCQNALRDELAVEPTRETQALYQWIKQTASKKSSLAARVTNLPIPISSFVGRNRELAKVKQLLSKARLVTLTGAGGSGKTRLAIHAATDLIDSFKDGVWWIELAPMTDPLLVPSAVAKALGIDGRSDLPLMDTLKKYLRVKQILLVFDNCEHLIDASAQLAESLLTSCAELKILATSRETLDLFGEIVWQVPTLSLPDVQDITLMDLLMQYEGIRLFAERAAAVNPSFAPNDEIAVALAQVCRRLDGIPLAIELAAARVKTMSITEIWERLDDRFQLLTAGNRTIQARHQTLRATVDWSYDLLTDEERRLFCRLSVFSGGWTRDAAEAVCSGERIEKGEVADLLARLVDKSLVTTDTVGERYGMLETLRQYAKEKLEESGEAHLFFKAHLEYFLKLAEDAEMLINGVDQMKGIRHLENELDNLRKALNWSKVNSFSRIAGIKLGTALWLFWKRSLRAGEGLMFLTHLLEKVSTEAVEEDDIYADALSAAGALAYIQSDFITAERYHKASLDIYRKLGNGNGIASSLQGLGNIALSQGIYESAQTLYQESLEVWKKMGMKIFMAGPFVNLGFIAYSEGKYNLAHSFAEDGKKIFQEFDNKAGIGFSLNLLGNIAYRQGDLHAARKHLEGSITIYRQAGDQFGEANAINSLAGVTLIEGNIDAASILCLNSLALLRKGGATESIVYCFETIAAIAIVRGQLLISAKIFGAAAAIRNNIKLALAPIDLPTYEHRIITLRDLLGEADLIAAWEAGLTLTMDEAVELAMTTVEKI
jgi:non-specific serine/threonine protein kinase